MYLLCGFLICISSVGALAPRYDISGKYVTLATCCSRLSVGLGSASVSRYFNEMCKHTILTILTIAHATYLLSRSSVTCVRVSAVSNADQLRHAMRQPIRVEI